MPVFGGKDIATLNKTVNDESKERRGSGDDRPILPTDKPVRMMLTDVKYTTVAAKKVPGSMFHKITLTMESNAEPGHYKPITMDYMVEATVNDKGQQGMSQNGIDVNQKMLIGFFQSAFGYDTPNASDYNQLVNAYQQHVRKPFMGAIQHQKRVYVKSTDDVKLFSEARLRYAGRAEEASKFSVSTSGQVLELKDEEQAIWSAFIANKSDAPTAGAQAASASDGLDGLDDIPFNL